MHGEDEIERTVQLFVEFTSKRCSMSDFRETRRELGDWNRGGTDRLKLTYPGNLNAGPKQTVPRVRKKTK